MREFTFTIEYERGTDPIMDAFIDDPDAVARSLDGFVTEERFWRIERIAGSPATLDRIEDIRFDDDTCGESLTERDCEATRYHDVLERGEGRLVIYTYLDGISACESVHTLSGKHLPPGLVFETLRSENRHSWRVLMRSDAKVGVLYDELAARLREGLSFRMGHLRDADGWQRDSLASVSVAAEQRAALQAAVEDGYYETPRETTLDELADELDVPRSTLSYRLRQAESQLARRYVADDERDRWLR
ncbi:helix-turn-helix domain-containing protein [Halococcus thailandensis]|uniref:Bacterio-opsin activator HTH domain protein n=1 Tax=Halococcus thailandensis JCM 13552 TaxID=1227457 RepID=M0MZV3_9EURY|nr:helix-turn-helix domain-containing protein [Halococcus thailandensis]EMA51136.1 Bacterio-opsin activator HTH domain protein [Halococcus thailandensis JCM 13552]